MKKGILAIGLTLVVGLLVNLSAQSPWNPGGGGGGGQNPPSGGGGNTPKDPGGKGSPWDPGKSGGQNPNNGNKPKDPPKNPPNNNPPPDVKKDSNTKLKKGKECDVLAKEFALYCPICDKISKDDSTNFKNGLCQVCGTRGENIMFCKKEYSQCQECLKTDLHDMNDPLTSCFHGGQNKVKKMYDYSLVIYVCPGCDDISTKSGVCKNKDCKEHYGKQLKITCEHSGEDPHVKWE